MIQIALLLYGLYALIFGKFALGREKVVTGTRARILGGLCWANIFVAFGIGIVWGIAAEMGSAELPVDGSLRIMEFGLVIVNLIVVFMIGNTMYARQLDDEQAATLVAPATPAAGAGYSPATIADPDNPFASPTQKS
ncbi:hypothetical protein [Aeoliella sp.]|uniref:hypothetical protein n=1 Tax=Aeoliella sp. TaxID=2795800 RepID=UPI003CCC3AEA